MEIKLSSFQKLLIACGVAEDAAKKVTTDRAVKTKVKSLVKKKEELLKNEGDKLTANQLKGLEALTSADPDEFKIVNDLKEEKEKTEKAEKKGGIEKVGVISTIFEFVQTIKAEKNAVTKEQILDHLCGKFPDRERDRMKKTVSVQVPSRLNNEKFKDKDVEIKSNKKKTTVGEGDSAKEITNVVYWVAGK